MIDCSYICRIDSHFIIKISDFGLMEDVFLRQYFREGLEGEGKKLPVKWMAPESLSDGHFSEKSDVVRNNHIVLLKPIKRVAYTTLCISKCPC